MYVSARKFVLWLKNWDFQEGENKFSFDLNSREHFSFFIIIIFICTLPGKLSKVKLSFIYSCLEAPFVVNIHLSTNEQEIATRIQPPAAELR